MTMLVGGNHLHSFNVAFGGFRDGTNLWMDEAGAFKAVGSGDYWLITDSRCGRLPSSVLSAVRCPRQTSVHIMVQWFLKLLLVCFAIFLKSIATTTSAWQGHRMLSGVWNRQMSLPWIMSPLYLFHQHLLCSKQSPSPASLHKGIGVSENVQRSCQLRVKGMA